MTIHSAIIPVDPSARRDYALIFLITLLSIPLKAGLLNAAGLDLHYDEAQYWEWAQQLDWSYYSKGPLVAWSIALSEALFGHGVWQTRLPAWLCHGAFIALLYGFARDVWQTRAAGVWAAMLGLCAPVYFMLGLVNTTDIWLFTSWAAGLWAAWHALARHAPRAWLLAGAAIGLGALTKLSIGLLPAFIGVAVLLDKRWRHHLYSPWLWAGVAVLFVVMSPVLLWNANHQWVMFRHELGHVENARAASLLEYFGGQWLALSPLVVSVAVTRLWRRPLLPEQRLLWWLTLAWMAFFLLKAFSAKVQINWPAPVYLGALVLFAGHVSQLTRRTRALVYAGFVSATALIGAGLFAPALGAKQDPLKDSRAWRGPVTQLATRYAAPDFMVASNYKLAAELAFYWPQPVHVYVVGTADRRYNQHDLWPSIAREAGRDGLFVSTDPSIPPDLARAFTRCAPATVLGWIAPARGARTFYVTVCTGYRPIAWPQPSAY